VQGLPIVVERDFLLFALNEHLSRTALVVQPLAIPASADIGERTPPPHVRCLANRGQPGGPNCCRPISRLVLIRGFRVQCEPLVSEGWRVGEQLSIKLVQNEDVKGRWVEGGRETRK